MAKKVKTWKDTVKEVLKFLFEFEYQFGEDQKVVTFMKTVKVLAGSLAATVLIAVVSGGVKDVTGLWAAIQSWALPLLGASGFAVIEKSGKFKVREG